MANLSTLVPAPRPITPVTAGANGGQNNVFVDSSPNNFVIARNGNTTQGTFSPYGDNWSNYFDGSDDYLAIADNVNLRPGAGAFTIEAWVYRFATGRHDTIYAKGGTSTGIVLSIINAGNLRFAHSASNFNSTGIIGPGVWTHVAVVREGTGTNQTKLYINGVQDGQGTVSTDFTETEEARIGTNRGGGDDFGGYISNFRFVKGTAVYTGAFTVPTSPLTAITNTQLLTCKSNRFRDESANAFAVTPNGNTSIQRFSPFSQVAYSTPAIGGSGYFDGSGDYLTAPNNAAFDFGSGDFTIEFYVYITSSATGEQYVFGKRASSVNYSPIVVGFFRSGGIYYLRYFGSLNGTTWGINGAFSSGSTIITLNTWTHIAVVRTGTTFRGYVNGVADLTVTSVSGALMTNSDAVSIGASATDGNAPLTGYISNLRILNGTAQYAADFTPPTAPLTAITNTSLLLNFTNAAILDNAMACALETVGNAQISTSVKKYGTGSLYFDGTGDWMFAPDSIDQRIGVANFTIECWLYLASTGAARGIVNKGGNTTGWALSVNAINNVVFTYDSSTITSTGTLSGSTWYHIAVVREGTGTNQTKIYIDGTNDGTGTVSSNFNQSERTRIGSNRTGGDPMNGYIDDVRITKGVARYTANFTPPQSALVADRDTVLLLNADSTSTSNIQVDTYTTTGTVHTWTKPYGAKVVMINIRGAGGGGGGGRGAAAGNVRLGGGGGGGGARVEQICTADCLPNTLYVIVGAGGAGGAGGNAAIGSAGTAGGNSFVAKDNTNPPIVDIVAFAGGGGGGSGGFQNSSCGGGGGGGSSGQGATSVGNTTVAGGWPGYSVFTYEANGGAGGPGLAADNNGLIVEWGGGSGGGNRTSGDFGTRRGQSSLYGSGGGSGGKCLSSANGSQSGGYGGTSGFYDTATAGAQPGADGTTGSAGSAGASYLTTGNGGGGGGAGGAGTGGTGGTGGAGGLGGGGGGGGGGGTTTGGTGGAGGNGVVEIITYF